MELRTEYRYDADAATVFAMLTDEAFLARKARATGALRHEASVVWAGDQVTVRLMRVMPPHVPDFVRRFIGETIDLEQTDVWQPAAADASRTGSIQITMSGAPVHLTGAMLLAPDGAQTTVTVDAQVKAAVPLFGGRVEEAVYDAVLEAAKMEEQAGQAWLAGDRGA